MTSIVWLARDFRLYDNEALVAAVKEGPVLPVFVIDRALRGLGAAPRWRLERALQQFNILWRARTGHEITVLAGEPEEILPRLAAQIGAKRVHQNDWPCPQMQEAQSLLRHSLATGTELVLHPGHLLISPARLRQVKATPYRVYTPFARAVIKLGPDRPIAPPARIEALPSLGPLSAQPALAPDLHGGAAVLADYALSAGEEAAFARLEAFFDVAPSYPEGRDRPDREVCSGLSEHLALGEISPRQAWAQAELRAQHQPALASGLRKFQAELLWREFAWHMLLDFPQLARQTWRPDWADFPWQGDGSEVEAWRRADTGIPLVDAGLREMRVTGRMHNRVRMVVASWLTKHLLADWRLGEAFFADSLTDWDPASNPMNWQWVAGCGPDASPFFRIFNPVKQAADYDPQGLYRRRWLAGWQGQTDATALAYFDTLPSDWALASRYQDRADEARLKQGRIRALDALAAHRISSGAAASED